MNWVECVAFLLVERDQVLVERRKTSKPLLPGAVLLPGGHIEADELPEAALVREAQEELGIEVMESAYICTLLERVTVHGIEGGRRLHYFCVTAWNGSIGAYEAEEVFWVPIAEVSRIEAYVDRLAVAEYLRIYRA